MPRGEGVQAARVGVRHGAAAARACSSSGSACRRQIPYVKHNGGGQGMAAPEGWSDGEEMLTGERLRPWFRALAQRLSRVIVLNRSWESAVTDSVLQQTPSSPKPVVAVFMDPPDKTTTADSDDRALRGRHEGQERRRGGCELRVGGNERRPKYRVAYAATCGRLPARDGWEVETRGFSGHRDEVKKAESTDMVMYSPACVGQGSLF